jgi:hypothetical protein
VSGKATGRIASAIAASILALALTFAAAPAHGDGDPASDVLLGQNVFYPYAPPVSGSLQNILNSETTAAARAHFPIKVALIESPVDLGVVTSLFHKPQQYADFLDQEISFQTKQPLLVVMPSGYGIQGLSPATAAAAASLAKPRGTRSNDLARAAITAVKALAAAAGHPIKTIANSSTTGHDGRSTSLTLVAAALAAVAASAAIVAFRNRPGRTPSGE